MPMTKDKPAWGRVVLKLTVIALSVIFISIIAVADYVTQFKTAVSLLYIAAIISCVWFSWGAAGIVIAALSGISDVVLTYIYTHSCQYIDVMNSAVQSIFFVVFTAALLALKSSRESLRRLSVTDPLTQVANRRFFFETGTAEAARAARYRHPFSIIYIDVDNFKMINDTMGHGAGDAVLRDMSKKVRGAIRRTDTMARLGGDEFAILMPETGRDVVKAAVKRIRESLLDVKAVGDKPVTFSIGVITNEGRALTFNELIKSADSLMYKAKHGGKNAAQYEVFKKEA